MEWTYGRIEVSVPVRARVAACYIWVYSKAQALVAACSWGGTALDGGRWGKGGDRGGGGGGRCYGHLQSSDVSKALKAVHPQARCHLECVAW